MSPRNSNLPQMDSIKTQQESTNKDLEADEVIPIFHQCNHEVLLMNAPDKELPPVQHLLADLGTMQRPCRMQEEEFEMDTQHIPPVSYRNTMETDEIKPNPLQGPDASQRVSDVTEIPQPLRVYQVWPGKNVSYGILILSSYSELGVYSFLVFWFQENE